MEAEDSLENRRFHRREWVRALPAYLSCGYVEEACPIKSGRVPDQGRLTKRASSSRARLSCRHMEAVCVESDCTSTGSNSRSQGEQPKQ